MSKKSNRFFPSIPKPVEDLLLRATKPFVDALKAIENAKILYDGGVLDVEEYHGEIDEALAEMHKTIDC